MTIASDRRSRGLYTYAVRRQGVVADIQGPDGRELRFQAVIARNDGWSRPQTVVVRPSAERPTLIDDVAAAVAGGAPVRMVVRFKRIAVDVDDTPFIRIVAEVDALLDGARAPDQRQMEMFR